MTKYEIDDALDEFHEQLHMPLLDAVNAVYKACPENVSESLSDAGKMLTLAAAALEGSSSLWSVQTAYTRIRHW